MKTYNKHINYPDKYYELFNCMQDAVVMYKNPSIVDFGTAMISKKSHKHKKK